MPNTYLDKILTSQSCDYKVSTGFLWTETRLGPGYALYFKVSKSVIFPKALWIFRRPFVKSSDSIWNSQNCFELVDIFTAPKLKQTGTTGSESSWVEM